MRRTQTLEMGGIYREKFVEYFLLIGGKTEDQTNYIGQYWEVMVAPQIWKMHGSLRIHHVSITFNVEENKFDEFLAEFRLNFLRAGG